MNNNSDHIKRNPKQSGAMQGILNNRRLLYLMLISIIMTSCDPQRHETSNKSRYAPQLKTTYKSPYAPKTQTPQKGAVPPGFSRGLKIQNNEELKDGFEQCKQFLESKGVELPDNQNIGLTSSFPTEGQSGSCRTNFDRNQLTKTGDAERFFTLRFLDGLEDINKFKLKQVMAMEISRACIRENTSLNIREILNEKGICERISFDFIRSLGCTEADINAIKAKMHQSYLTELEKVKNMSKAELYGKLK